MNSSKVVCGAGTPGQEKRHRLVTRGTSIVGCGERGGGRGISDACRGGPTVQQQHQAVRCAVVRCVIGKLA